MIVYQGNNYQIRVGDLLSVAGVPVTRQVIAGTGMSGGGQLSSNVTLSIAQKGVTGALMEDTGVTSGVYGDATHVPVLTVDSTGRVTAASSIPVQVSGYVPTTREVIAGEGLQGGGTLNTNVTLSAKLGEATPLTGDNAGSAGVATSMSREDHRHPAVDLADGDQVDNVLGLMNGGTANSLVPDAGAIIWCGADGLYVGPVGEEGQVLVSSGTGEYTWGSAVVITPQAANTFFAGPTTGSDADPTFRAMVNADLPDSGATAGTYGSALAIPVVTVNAKGVVTSITTTTFTGGLSYKGAWNASTNTPTLVSGTGTNGDYYVVSVAGSTNLDGITDWQVGDWALFNGTVWQKIDQTNSVTSVNGQQGAVVLGYADVGAPSTSGTNATGTWAIDISGNAATATSATTADKVAHALTIGSGLSGTSYDGSAAVTITNTAPDQVVGLTAGTGISTSGTYPSFTITNTAPDQVVSLTAGTGMSVSGSYPSFTLTNTAPDQVVSLTGAGTTTVTGTYPNFTITSNDAYTGTVTSVATGTGLTGGPITSSGTISFSNSAVGTWAATPSSANLAAAMTDETGSGSLVFANGPTLSAPTIDGSNPYVQFNNGSAVTNAAGRMWYNGSTGSLNFGMGGGNITQQVGEELFLYGKASSAITDSPLQIIYQTGTVGASGVITFAPTVSGITDGNLIVGIATENLSLNAFGRVTTFGVVHGVTTDGSAYGETWADGDVIWYNPVTGNPTKTKPSAPNLKVSVGTVINAGSGGSGSFQVEINHGSVLGGTDSNVQLTSPSNGQILTYNGAGTYWKNTSLTAGTGISVSAAADGTLTVTNTSPSSGGTVTSVSGTGTVSGISLSGTVTSSGSLTLGGTLAVTPSNFSSQTANTFLAAPNGSAGTPTFRAIVAADVPTLNQNTTGTAAGLSSTLAIASGGTGQTTAAAAFNALSPVTTAGDLIIGNGVNSSTRLAIGSNATVLTSNGTTASWAALPAGVSSFSAGTTGFTPSTGTAGAVTLAGTLNVANGGTGLTSLTANYIPYGNGTGAYASSASFTYSDAAGVKAPQVNATNGLHVNSMTVSASYTVASGDNAMSVGPMTVASGVAVTVSSGSRWVVI